MLRRRSDGDAAKPAIEGASGLVILQGPDHEAAISSVIELLPNGREQARSEPHALKNGRNVKLENFPRRPWPSSARFTPGRVTLRETVKNEHGNLRAALDLALPPCRSAPCN